MDTLAMVSVALMAIAPAALLAAPVPARTDDLAVSILVADDAGRWFPEQVDNDDPFALSQWRVVPNVRGLAARPDEVEFPLPDGRVLTFTTERFDYVSGFDLDDDFNIIIDPDTRNLDYYWSGVGPEGTASASVHRGTFRAQVISFRDRVQVAHDRFGRDTFSVLDTAKLSGVQCISLSESTIVGLSTVKASIDPVGGTTGPRIDARPMSLPTPMARASGSKYLVEIDVAFLYTPTALQTISSSGDIAAFEPIIADAMAQLNESMQATQAATQVRFRRVGPMVPINYDETPQQTNDGFRWQAHRNFMIDRRESTGADGINIAGTRATYGADLVVMFVGDQGGATSPFGPWGIAVVQRQRCVRQFPALTCEPGPQYRDFAFVVQTINRATTDLNFAHEIGHALGSEHDRAGTPGVDFVDWTTIPTSEPAASFAHSFGYRVGAGGTASGQGDVMTSPPCFPPTNSANCWTRVRLFADPLRTFSVTGLPAGQTAPGNPGLGYGYTARTFNLLAEQAGSFYGPTLERPMFWNGFDL